LNVFLTVVTDVLRHFVRHSHSSILHRCGLL